MFCHRLTNAIRHVMKSHSFDLVLYLDGMVTTECWDKADACFSRLREIIISMGAVEARSKAVGPCTSMHALCICFHIELLMIEVPQERVWECMGLLIEWLNKSEATREEMESQVRTLGFITTYVRSGWLSIPCLLDYLKVFQRWGR